MTITFLGTGTSQGIPVIGCHCDVCNSLDYKDKRLRTSVHIATSNKSIVIDTGPDFRQQMLRERIESLDAVLYTHEHKDHTAGLDDIRSYNFIQQNEIPIYASKQVIDQLKQEFAYIFAKNKYPGVPQVDIHFVETHQDFQIGEVNITPISLLHYKLPVFGYRIGDFVYITDANHIDDEELHKLSNAKILVINALHKEKHISHFNLSEALSLIKKVKPKKAYLIHLSHQMGTHQSTSLLLPSNVEIAYDGFQVVI